MFSNIKNCPFCGSKNVKIIKNNELSTNFYVEEIITDLKVSFSFLKNQRCLVSTNYGICQSYQIR